VNQQFIESELEKYVDALKNAVSKTNSLPSNEMLEERLVQALRLLGLLRIETEEQRFLDVLNTEIEYWAQAVPIASIEQEAESAWKNFQASIEKEV